MSAPLTIRLSAALDTPTLEQLAQLDSRRLPPGPHLVAELDERLVAAVSEQDGSAVADPFVPTAELVDVLRLRAAQRRATATRRAVRRSSPTSSLRLAAARFALRPSRSA